MYWMHNGFLQVEGEKMSKSLGNFVTIHELLHSETFGGRKWPGEVLRLAMLKTHYRQPIDFTLRALEEADATLDEWARFYTPFAQPSEPAPSVLEALSDDLNTTEAIAELHRLRTAGDGAALRASLDILGLGRRNIYVMDVAPGSYLVRGGDIELTPKEQEERIKIEQRLAARTAKNWAELDRIRDELAAMGVQVKDNKDGTTSREIRRLNPL